MYPMQTRVEGILMEEFAPPRRSPARPKKISEIKVGDERVRITGLVVSKKEAELEVDDGSGHIKVLLDDPTIVKEIVVGSKVRVFGTPLNVNGGHELYVEIVQKVDDLDLELEDEVRREVKKLEMKIGEESK
jgi:RNase P/RNase MRP subunit p29